MRSRRIFINLVGWILGGVTGTIAMMLVAKYSGSLTLGVFAYAIAFLNTFASPSALDLETAHLRILSSRQDDDGRARAVGAYGVLRAALSLTALVTLTVAIVLGFSDTIDSDLTLYVGLLAILFLSSVLNRLATIPIVTFAAYGQTAKQQVSLTFGKLSRNLFLACFGVMALGAISLGLAYAIGGAVTIVTAVYLFRGYRFKWPTKSDLLEYIRFGGPMMIAPMFTSAIMSVDKLFVGEFWGESPLGVYYLAQSIAMSLLFIDASVRYVFIPGFVNDIKEGKYDKIEAQAGRMSKYIYLGLIPVIVFTWFYGEDYFGIMFGEQFREAAPVLAIQLIGITASLMGDPLVSVVVATGKSKAVLTAAMLGLATSILVLTLLVPEELVGIRLPGMGIKGAAIAFASAFIVQLAYYRLSASIISKYISWRHLALTLTVPVVVACALALVPGGHLGIADQWWTVLMSVVFVLLTVAGLAITRAFSKDDLRFIVRAISIKENARYIKEEIGAEPPGGERIE